MTRYGMTLLSVGLVLVVSQVRAEDKGDKEKFQGEWSLVCREVNGESQKITKDSDDYIKLEIEGDNFHMTFAGRDFGDATFAVDSSKKPKTIDITFKSKEDGVVMLGIYELDGDTLKICLGSPVFPARPAEFKSKGDARVFTYKRVKK